MFHFPGPENRPKVVESIIERRDPRAADDVGDVRRLRARRAVRHVGGHEPRHRTTAASRLHLPAHRHRIERTPER